MLGSARGSETAVAEGEAEVVEVVEVAKVVDVAKVVVVVEAATFAGVELVVVVAPVPGSAQPLSEKVYGLVMAFTVLATDWP